MINSFLLLTIILLPLIGALLVLSAQNMRSDISQNTTAVTIWIKAAEVALILYTFSFFDIEKSGIQLVEKYSWSEEPEIDILLGADLFSMLLLFTINLSFLIADICLNRNINHPKILFAAEMLFLSLLNGYLLAADIISFYIFFGALCLPLIILISTYGSQNKKNMFIRFSLYSLIGAIALLVAVLLIYVYKQSNIPLNTAGNLNLTGKMEYAVWLSLFFAFISRLPIWPFHHWVSVINATLRQPLVFNMSNLLPLVGLYGFMRFWPNTVPQTIAEYTPLLEIICIITMVFISLISLNNKEFRYKLFAYTTICYLLYLIGVLLPTGKLKMNIGYSLFAYMLIITILSLLISHIENIKKEMALYADSGLLCYMPRISICISLYVLAAIGLPITPLFWNNFIIISEILNENLVLGVLTMLSLFIVSLSLLEELYKMKDKSCISSPVNLSHADISKWQFGIYIFCLLILFFSFFKPLWFVL